VGAPNQRAEEQLMTGTAPVVGTSAPVVPVPRSAADDDRPRRRQRPPSQYWDVFDACWRTADGQRR
jgi:hypothetical protein